ncbi:unnamed protein product [Pleuronectes platessa]|uniref:Uncharacterized protein n=1 Tax=Pleuronectes platessa TaxID=8262 RepID=A0A9N7TLB0_PLEPL|nr:unnamed protein product [Pleuronectes platessa]
MGSPLATLALDLMAPAEVQQATMPSNRENMLLVQLAQTSLPWSSVVRLATCPDSVLASRPMAELLSTENKQGRGWLVTAAGRDTPASNSTNHHCYISLVVSSLRRPIIPSSMDACVPHCSALRPPTCQDLQASLHPASPAFSCLVSNKLCSIPINYHSVSASGSDP